jgi:hypothetical protein
MHDLATIIAINRKPTQPSRKDRFGCFTETERAVLYSSLLDFSTKQTTAWRAANDSVKMAGSEPLPLQLFGIESTNSLVDELGDLPEEV